MTRFDEALREFAASAEPTMRARVSATGNLDVTVTEVGRGRGRRSALQATATLAAVAVLATGAIVAAGMGQKSHEVAPGENTIEYLGDPAQGDQPAFACGVPFPLEAGVTSAPDAGELPAVTQQLVIAPDGLEVLDLRPNATTVGNEFTVRAESAAEWTGAAPGNWGLTTYAALVDENGNVAARSLGIYPAYREGTDSAMQYAFMPESCRGSDSGGVPIELATPLAGTFGVHIVTQLWVDDPQHPVAMWVDEGLHAGAEITVDPTESGLDAAQRRSDALSQRVKNAIAASDQSLATVSGPSAIGRTSSCALTENLSNLGSAGLRALPLTLPGARATLDDTEITWTYTVAEGEPWWAEGGDFAVAYFTTEGDYAGMASAELATTSEAPTGITSRARLDSDPWCPLSGVPTASGSYEAFVFVPLTLIQGPAVPADLQDIQGWVPVSAWAPLGTYTVP